MNKKQVLLATVIAALGYFVDAFDLIVASVVRSESITYLNLAMDTNSIKSLGLRFETVQSWGVLLGGIAFGILGDRIGRTKVLFSTIALYSFFTLLNGLIQPHWPYKSEIYSLCRFFSGFGLAGELGIGITLVTEIMKKETRGWGSALIASFGLLGCVVAGSFSAFLYFKWDILFILGGGLGLLLLATRFTVKDSQIFTHQASSKIAKGAFFSIFTNYSRLKRFIICILIGLPTYFVVGLPIKFAANYGAAMQIEGVSVAITMITFYLAMSLGDIICNTISQKLESRKKVFVLYNIFNFLAILFFSLIPPKNIFQYQYIYSPLLGLSVGYWALIVTYASESFGTNLRATVATTVPNFIRASFILIVILFEYFESIIGTINSGIVVGAICSFIAIIASLSMKETFSIDLNYTEE